MSAILLFGAPPEAEQHREVHLRGLNALLMPDNLVGAVRFGYATRSFCRELMSEERPPYLFDSGDMHIKLIIDGARAWMPVDQSASAGLSRRRLAELQQPSSERKMKHATSLDALAGALAASAVTRSALPALGLLESRSAPGLPTLRPAGGAPSETVESLLPRLAKREDFFGRKRRPEWAV